MARFDLSSKSFNTTTHLNFPRAFEDHPDSGVCSPPLWRTTTSPPPNNHRHDDDYESLSPPAVSKAQVIARGQRELMDMVSKMPESCYELSLKDLVEVVNTEEEDKYGKVVFDELPQRIQKTRPSKVVRKTKSDRWVDPIRNGHVNNSGFLLKLVFPVSLGSKKKTKKKDHDDDDNDDDVVDDDDSSVTSKGSRFSSRPEDKDWWKNGLSESRRSTQTQTGLVSRINSGSSKSSGTGSSSRSNSDRSRNSLRDENRGCLSCLWNVHLRDL